MTYAEMMLQAYAEACGITREEAITRHGFGNLMPTDRPFSGDQLDESRVQDLLNDLRRDPHGVLAWVGEAGS